MHEVLGEVHVVVDQEDDVRPDVAAGDEVRPLLDHGLAGGVGRVGLAGEDELRPAARAAEDALQPGGVVQQEVHALVGGEPAGEADGEHFGIAQAVEVRAQAPPGCRRWGPGA